jgi:hypothetical protein
MTWALVAVFVIIMIRRLTAGLSQDLKKPKTGVGAMFLNRFLYDRSYY